MNNTTKSTATFVKDVSAKFNGEARLYKTDDGFVVASSTFMSLGFGTYGSTISEVMVFSADENGAVTDWGELGVAYPAGEFDAALADAGFEVAS